MRCKCDFQPVSSLIGDYRPCAVGVALCVNIVFFHQQWIQSGMGFTASESLAEQIATHLADRIIQGELHSGERIQEARVVSELSVSRGSVREALLLLESRHLIDILPRRGAVVAALTESGVRSLYDVYVTLLSRLAQTVAERWDEASLPSLLAQVHVIQGLAEQRQPSAFIDAGFGLMKAAFAVADNPYFTQLLSDLQPAIHRTYALALRHSVGETSHATQFFTDLMNAVVKRDRTVIPAVVERYGQHQCELVLAALTEPLAHHIEKA